MSDGGLKLRGQVVAVLGDNIDTDLIYPGRYLNITDREKTAEYLFELAYPQIRGLLRCGDFPGRGQKLRLRFQPGAGGGRAEVRWGRRHHCSFVRPHLLPQRHQSGLPAVVSPQAGALCSAGDELVVDLAAGEIRNLTQNRLISAAALDERAVELLAAGGLIPYLKHKYAA
jgi:3-isopropylmalate/(R)-2-methylmalate dehydratase small subunit